MEAAEKVRENRLRRKAARQGYRLTRTRRRDPDATDYGTYYLTPARPHGKDKPIGPMAIDEVEYRLTHPGEVEKRVTG